MKASEIIRRRRRNRKNKVTRAVKSISALRILSFILICVAITFIILCCAGYAVITQKLPPIENFDDHFASATEPTIIYDRTGTYPLLKLRYPTLEHVSLAIDEPDKPCFSSDLVKIIVATHQPNFWSSVGADWHRWSNPDPVTIAERLVQQTFPNQLGSGVEKAILTKILATQITKIYGPQAILTWYLNSAYFGQLAVGADAAARTYLDKSASDLNLSESILLSAILDTPSLNPVDAPGVMRESYLAQIEKLEENGTLTEEEIRSVRSTNFVIFEPPPLEAEIAYSPGLQQALSSAYETIGQEAIERGGYKIRSTIDYDLQTLLECLTGIHHPSSSDVTAQEKSCPYYPFETRTEDQTAEIAKILSQNPISAVVIDIKSGQMIASIDVGPDGSGKRTARKVFSQHEPGSTLTPFVVLSALNRGISLSSMVWDLAEQRYYLPSGYQNPDGRLQGPIRLRTAVDEDIMGPVAEMLREVGTAPVWNQATQFGITGVNARTPESILFSGGSVTVDMLANAYLPFANQGRLVGTIYDDIPRPKTILSITSPEMAEIPAQMRSGISLLDPGLAYLMVNLLAEDKQSYRYFNRPAGTKVGRVLNSNDFWMIGFTPEIMTVVWIGGTPNGAGTDQAAILLWQTIMAAAVKNQPITGWSRPETVSQLMVCNPSGKLPTDSCPDTVSEVFLAGNEPTEYDDLYVRIPINRNNLKMATAYTKFADIEQKVYMNLPKEANDWAIDNHIETMPAEYDPIPEMDASTVKIYQPINFSIFKKTESRTDPLEIKAEINIPEEILSVQVVLGKGFYPDRWYELNNSSEINNGRWTLAKSDWSALDPALYDLRVSVITKDLKYYRADQYFSVQ